MKYLNNWIRVKELKRDFVIDGLIEKYDSNSSTFFGRIEDCDDSLKDNFRKIDYSINNLVLQLSRLNKTESLGGYLVKAESIIAIMTLEEFEKLCS